MKKLLISLLCIFISVGCEKTDNQPSSGSINHNHLKTAMRNYNIIILGDGYKGSQGTSLFNSDANKAISAFQNTAPFSTRSDLSFFPKLWKQNLGCDDNTGLNEGVSCSSSKVINAALSVNEQPDLIIVLMNGKGHGGSDCDRVAVIGLGNHASNPAFGCTFDQAAFLGKMMHEVGHCYLGPNHLEGTKMGSCTNGCCEVWNKPFNSNQQDIITLRINAVVSQ